MESTDSERVSRAVTTLVGAGDTIGVCDLKTALANVLFSCPVAAGSSDELAFEWVAGALWGCNTTSLWVCGLA